jgi:hypothetical protein
MTIYYIDDAVQQRAVVIPSGVEGNVIPSGVEGNVIPSGVEGLGKKVTIKII